MTAPVYYFFHGKFPEVDLFDLWHYINVTDEGPEEIIFYPAEALACTMDVMQPIYDMDAYN